MYKKINLLRKKGPLYSIKWCIAYVGEKVKNGRIQKRAG